MFDPGALLGLHASLTDRPRTRTVNHLPNSSAARDIALRRDAQQPRQKRWIGVDGDAPEAGLAAGGKGEIDRAGIGGGPKHALIFGDAHHVDRKRPRPLHRDFHVMTLAPFIRRREQAGARCH